MEKERIVVFLILVLCFFAGTKRSRSDLYIPITVSVFLGLLLRILFIDFPYNYHHDERWKVEAVSRMIETGSLNPKYFLHPSLLLYLTYFMSSFIDDIQLAGRLVSSIAGTLTIGVLYYGSRKFIGKSTASVAAFLFALNPLAITCSRYLKEDSLLVLFTTSCFFLVLHSKVLSAVFAGLALGTKYTGALCFGLLFFSKQKISKVLLMCAIGAVVFIITTPFSVLDFNTFFDGVMYEKRHAIIGNTVPISIFSQLGLFHFFRGVLPSYLFIGALFIPIGFGVLKNHWRWITLGLIFFYLPAEIVQSKIEPQPERYILPAIPILSILAAGGILSFRFKPVFLALLSLPGIFGTLELKSDSRVRMQKFIESNIPKDAKILIDNQFNSPKLPGFTNVQYMSIRPLVRGFREEFHPDNLRKNGYDYALVSNFTYRCLLFCKEAPNLARNGVIRLFRRLPLVHQERAMFISFGFHSPTVSLLKVTKDDELQSTYEFGLNPFWIIPEPFDRLSFLESKE